MQAKLDNEVTIRDLNEEKQQLVNELYVLRMDITKKIEETSKKSAHSTHLQDELQHAHKKVAELMKKDNELATLQNDIESFIGFFSQMDKHMKTHMKLLREFISRCDDPKLIEHNQKQVKSIEGLLDDVKNIIKSREYAQPSSDGANKLLESFFQLSNESLRDVHNSVIATDVENNSTVIKHKKRKLNEQGDYVVVLEEKGKGYDSAAEEGTIIGKKQMNIGTVTKKQKKMNEKALLTTEKKPIDFDVNATPRRSDRNNKKTTETV
jgi:hypothetical protein